MVRNTSGSQGVKTKAERKQLPINLRTEVSELPTGNSVQAQDHHFDKAGKTGGLLDKYVPPLSKAGASRWDTMSANEIQNLQGHDKQAFQACMRQRKKRTKEKTTKR